MNHRFFRPIAIIVLACFSWTFLGLFDIAYAFKNSPQTSDIRHQTKEKKAEEKFQDALEKLREAGERAYEKLGRGEDAEAEETEIKTKKAEIENLDGEIRNQFKETEEKIKDLPEVIKQRHRDFVRKYEENLNTLRINLDEIEKAKTKEEKENAHKKTKDFLEKTKPPKKHIPLDPNKLPHRTPEVEKREPRTKPEEFRELSTVNREPILVASAGSLAGLLSSTITQASSPPTAADLAETIEVQFTPEIRAKAVELNYNPVKIYNWVRNNIEFVPTYGSMQGANMCLQTKLCNDFDTASLLIALLRTSGIHARYVYGTVEMPIEKVKNWLGGFTDSMAALNLIASGGIPTAGQVVGGEIKYVRIEHIWVEAWVDYIPSRGARHKSGQGDTWIPLDASFKQYTYTQGMDIKTAVPFDSQSFINQIQSTATINETEGYVTNVNSTYIQTTMQDYQTQVQNYISQNYPNATVGEVLGKKETIKQEFPYLLGTLPYKTIAKGATYSELPNSLRHRLTFEVYKDIYDELLGTKITATKTLPELAGKRISLNYVPATDADKNLLDSYVQNYATSVPAYLINLKAELKIDNTVIATGTSITMGTDQILNLTFAYHGKSETETHLMTAGDYNVIGLNIGGARRIFEKRSEQNDFTDAVSEMLYQTVLAYWAEYDTLNDIYSNSCNVAARRLPSEGLSYYPINIKYMFGIPYQGYYSGTELDIKRDLWVLISLNGDKEMAKIFNLISGIGGSSLEGFIFDQLFRNTYGDGLSAIKILNLTNSQNIPIYYINSSNINGVVNKLLASIELINDIKNAVNAGKEVIVPQRGITYNGWSGTAYIALDPANGTGAYVLEGGAAGGFQAKTEAAYAVALAPYTPLAMENIIKWINSKPEAVVLRASSYVGVQVPRTIPWPATGAGTGALSALGILALAFAISIVIEEVTDRSDNIWWTFYHYTTPAGRAGILAGGIIYPSLEGDFGYGAYVTDQFIDPTTRANRERMCFIINRMDDTCLNYYTAYVTVKIDEYIMVRLYQGKWQYPDKDQYRFQYKYPGPLGPNVPGQTGHVLFL